MKGDEITRDAKTYFYCVLRRARGAQTSLFLSLSPSLPYSAVPHAGSRFPPRERNGLIQPPRVLSPPSPNRPSVHSISRPSANASPTLTPALGLSVPARKRRKTGATERRQDERRARANMSSFRELSPSRSHPLCRYSISLSLLIQFPSLSLSLSLPPSLPRSSFVHPIDLHLF